MTAKEPPKNDIPQPENAENTDEIARDNKRWEEFDRAVEGLSRKRRPKPADTEEQAE